MRKLILLLVAAQLLASALAQVPAPERPPEDMPPVTAQPEPGEELSALLERITGEYDPAAAGTVGAIRWAEKLLDAWDRSGGDGEAFRRAAENADAEALAPRLPKLRWAAEKLCSGADLGLMNEPGHRSDWSGTDVDRLFAALYEGAGLPPETE